MNVFETALEKANNAFQAGRYNEALGLYLSLSRDHPGYADIFNKLGLILHHNGDTTKAIDYFEKALKINPLYTEASLNLTISYNDIGEYEKASKIFSHAAEVVWEGDSKIDPFVQGKLANEHATLGDTYYEAGLLEEAEKQYRTVLGMRPNFVDVLTKLGITLREKGDFDEAIAHFKKAKKINARYIRALIHLGITYYSKGFTDLALIEWETASKINPEGKEARVYLALARKEIVDH